MSLNKTGCNARQNCGSKKTVRPQCQNYQTKRKMETIKSNPVVPWIGGKRRLVKHIIPLFPEHSCYVEPFCGAAALFFLKKPVKSEILNDVNGELINLYRVVKNHFEEFIRQFKWVLTSREIFKLQQITPTETLTDIQRAARFFYLQKLAFGGKVDSQTFGTDTTRPARFNLLRLEEDLSAAHLRLSTATIEHLDWVDCIKNMIVRIPFFIVIRHIGKQKVMVSILI